MSEEKISVAGAPVTAAPQKHRDPLALIVRFQSLIGLVLVAIGGIIFSPRRHGAILFLDPDNIANIVRAVSETGIIAIGMTFVIITAGIDLSVGTMMTFCSVMAGVFLTYWGLPIYFGIFAAIFFGALCGWTSGMLIAKLKVPPFIATLGMMMLLKGLSLVISGTCLLYTSPSPRDS